MRIFLHLLLLLLLPITAHGQADSTFFKGVFSNREHGVSLHIDLYEPTLEAPGLSFLGPLHGYMEGKGIYGTWMITRHSVKGKTATVRMSNDTGADAQSIVLKQLSDSTMSFRTVEGNNIRKAIGRKLVKIVPEMVLTKRKP